MVYGTLPFWPPSGNHNELEMMIKHRELSFPAASEVPSASLAAGTKTSSVGGREDMGASSGEEQDMKGGGGSTVGAGAGAPSAALAAHDPMVGYLRVSPAKRG